MNTISGTSGNDLLTGTSGNDYMDGGAGADTMSGAGGDDVFIVDNPGDVVTEKPGEGKDWVNSTVSYSLPANVENLWLVGSLDTSGTGNELDNSLWGNGGRNVLIGVGGNDYIDGGAGADTMLGGAGDDAYWVDSAGDTVTENAGEGSDTIRSSLANYALPANTEDLVLIPGAGNINGAGNELANHLTGNEGDNVLAGGGGNDAIDGGAGADTMRGGAGDDSYWVDNVGDVVTENAAEGVDTAYSSLANYILPANVENLTLGIAYGSVENLNGAGNDLGNVLKGNGGNNVLAGGAGDDTLTGGNGNDTLTGGPGNDVFYISTTDTGTDTITDLAAGDVIQVCGAFSFDGSATQGDGTALKGGEVQLAASGGQTMLYIGTDATPGADVAIALDGSYSARYFSLSGFEIRYDTNSPPVLSNPLADQQVTEGTPYSLYLPADTFTDVDGDALAYSAAVVDPDWGYLDLPAWLKFNAATRAFSGSPAKGDIGSFMVMVMATDPKGASGDGAFTLTVEQAQSHVNHSPTGSVTLNGTAAQGQTLTVAHTLADADGLGAIGFQWKADGSLISGATAPSLLLAEAQVGKAITVTASYTDRHGAAEAVASSATSKVANVNDGPTGLVTLSGVAAQGQTLSASNTLDDADGLGTIGYQWQMNAGAAWTTLAQGGSFTLTQAQVGKSIRVVASYTDGHGTAESAYSSATANVRPAQQGTPGNDMLLGGFGAIDGGDGVDTVQYAGNRSPISHNADGTYTVGTDTLTRIERLQFADAKVAIDIDGSAGITARILGVVFGAASLSNKQYVGIGLSYLDNGWSYESLMTVALNAAGATTHAAVVNMLWSNLFGSAPTAEQAAPYVVQLDNGSYTPGSLGVMAANLDLNSTRINLAGLYQTGIEYS